MEKFNEQLTNKQLADIAISAACKALSAIEKIEQNAVTSTEAIVAAGICAVELDDGKVVFRLNSGDSLTLDPGGEKEKLMVCLQMSKPRFICDRY